MPFHLSWLGNEIITIDPKSILDIGVGFGAMGVIFRELTDLKHERYFKKDWRVKIDGIEIYEKYLTKLHKYIYNKIYIGDACEVIDKVGEYDLIYLGDVLEHIEKEQGRELLEKAKIKARTLVISTPVDIGHQKAILGNNHEAHISQWYKEDFEGADISIIENVMAVKYKNL